MPGRDGTGPEGRGPMTGGRRGYCGARRPQGNIGTATGFGFGRGGRGKRNRFLETGLPGWMRKDIDRGWSDGEADTAMLKNMEAKVEEYLEKIKKRINELEKIRIEKASS